MPICSLDSKTVCNRCYHYKSHHRLLCIDKQKRKSPIDGGDVTISAMFLSRIKIAIGFYQVTDCLLQAFSYIRWPGSWYWEIVEMSRKVIITSGLILIGQETRSYIGLAWVIAGIYGVLFAWNHPIQYVVLGPRKSPMPLICVFSENDKISRQEKKYVE